MAPLPGLNKGVFKDPSPPLVDSLLSPQTIPNGTTLITTKPQNETVDNVNELIDYVSGDNGPNFIPQLAIDSLVADLAARELLANKVTTIGTPGNDVNYGTEKAIRDALNLKEDSLGFTPENIANKGAVSGYAGLDASQELLLTNFPSGIALQVQRRNADNTALEFATVGGGGGQVDSVVGTLDRISVNSTDPVNPIVDIDSGYVGQASITTLGTITTGVWNGTAITGAFINAASTDLTDSANIARDSNNLSFFAATTSAQLAGVISDETGTGLLVFGTSPTIITPTIASFVNAGHDHETAAGGGTLLSTSALSDTANIAYLNTPNVYTAGVRQDFLGLLAGTAGINVGGIAGNPTTQVDGDIWLNTATNQGFMRINGADVDIGAGAGGEVFTWTNDHSMATFKLTAAAANNVILNAPNGQGVSIEVAGTPEYLFNATDADFLGNNLLLSGGLLQFDDTNTSIQQSSANLEYDVATGNNHNFRVNNSTEVTINATGINVGGNNLTNAVLITQVNTGGSLLRDFIVNASIADDTIIGSIRFRTNDGLAALQNYANIVGTMESDVDAAEAGSLKFMVTEAGVHDVPYMSFNDASSQQIDVFRSLNINGNTIINTGILTLPTSTDTLIGRATTDILTNKSYDLGGTGNVLTGSVAEFNAALQSETFAFIGVANVWGTINQNIAATGKWQEGGINISPIGLHDQYLDAGGFIPVDAEALSTRAIGTGINQKGVVFIPFLTAVTTFATIKFKLPRLWNNGTITAVINWTSQTEGAGDVIWGVSGVAVADGDDLAAVATDYGTEITVTDTQTTIEFSQDSPRTAAITLGNIPADADTLYLKVQRRGADGGDTFPQEAQLLGVYIDLTTDAAVSV